MKFTTKQLAIALAVSVAVNLFLAGFLTQRALRGARHHEHGSDHGHFLGPRGLSRDGDPAAEKALRRAMREHGVAFRARGDELRAARGAVSTAFAAEPFDARALEQRLAALRAATAESQALMHASLVAAAPELSPAQRRQLAKRVLEREPGFGRRGPRPH